MIEKKFLEEVIKGTEGNFDQFGKDLVDLLEWAIGSNFVSGISYTGYGSKVNINMTTPRLTVEGDSFLKSLEGDSETEETMSFDTDGLLEQVKGLSKKQQQVLSTFTNNIEVLDEIRALDEEKLATIKGDLIKLRIEDVDKSLPWDTLLKVVSLLK